MRADIFTCFAGFTQQHICKSNVGLLVYQNQRWGTLWVFGAFLSRAVLAVTLSISTQRQGALAPRIRTALQPCALLVRERDF